MKNNNRGATVLSIGIAVVVLLIITATITFSSIKNLSSRKLDNLYNDIRILNEKVEIYYLRYGSLPVGEEFTSISVIPEEVLNPNDNDKYYKINLNALENLTLSTPIDEQSFFIINEQSHTIYYPKGVTLQDVTYYRLPELYSKIYTDAELAEIAAAEEAERIRLSLITEWTIPEDGTQIQLPVRGNVSVIVNWGDGTKEEVAGNITNTADFPVHTYATAGSYDVQIIGTCEYFGYYTTTVPTESSTDKDYYTFTQYVSKVKSWGILGYKLIRIF